MTKPLEVTLQFGSFRVVEATSAIITIQLNKDNFINLHIGSVPHLVKVGDQLPLFTRVPYGKPGN